MNNIEININYNNLIYNFELLKKISKCDVIFPTIKANAYNLGFKDIVRTLLNINKPQKKYFVFSLNEGINLRNEFLELEEICILSGIFEGDAEYFKKYNLIPVINDFQQLELCKKNNINKIILQFNTGMNRSGIEIKEIKKIKDFIDNSGLEVFMVMSHFCCADDKNNLINKKQVDNFKKILKYFPDKNILKSLSASDGIINFDLSDFCNSCRPGMILYGYYKNFKSVYSFYSKVLCENNIFYMPLGINHGILSSYKNGFVFIEGQKIKVLDVLNDKTILDIKDILFLNKRVEILGDNITMQDIEKMCKTDIREIAGRLLTNINEKPKNIENTYKIKAVSENKNIVSFYSTILEKRTVSKNGIVGYGATEKVKKGDKLATFAGGYLDGLSRIINNKKCYVFVEKIDGSFTKCEIFGRISMDQTTIKISKKDYNNIRIGSRVIIFDKKHSTKHFEKRTNKSKKELFFYIDKSNRIDIVEQ